jgi:hypothetical protein
MYPQIADLAELYYQGMEVQVNVDQDGGERISGEFHGRRWIGWTDHVQTWKPFRIPNNAKTVPTYEDKEITFDLEAHAQGIGFTGWDWYHRVSKYVAFDFDSITNHKEGLTEDELEHIKQLATALPFVTVRKSTSGRGIHLYVYLNNASTMNHNEHAALARSILSKMSSLTGFDFNTKVDTCGGNMWIWHRKMAGTDGLTIIKQGCVLDDIPPNWRDHLTVVSRKRHKIITKGADNTESNEMEELANNRIYAPLDETHLKIIKALEDAGGSTWDSDHSMLTTHTTTLALVHEQLGLRGVFKTISNTEPGVDWNVFMFPATDGSWVVRRFTKHCQEANTWDTDATGWTRCYYNRNASMAIACRAYGGIEREKGGFLFQETAVALQALQLLGTLLNIPNSMLNREAIIKERQDNRLSIKIKRKEQDDGGVMVSWEPTKDMYWSYIVEAPKKATDEIELANYDKFARHLITGDGSDHGWVINIDGKWISEPLVHVKHTLAAMGLHRGEIDHILGHAIKSCWTLVNEPFQAEYPGQRKWNRDAAQLRYLPREETDDLNYPHWKLILHHCGSTVDDAVRANPWCKVNGIETGADYLKCWIASLFQEPLQPLPYLFFYGEQNSGKSIIWEALNLLMTKGVMDAGAAVTSESNFNAELEGALLCIIEELNLRRNMDAYTKIKQWVTAIMMSIHRKQKTPYMTKNVTHWMHFANDQDACPVFPGDTRVVVIHVPPINPLQLIPKKQLLEALEKEATDFITEILNMELPPSNDRLNIPPIMTEAKADLQLSNETELQTFIRERCFYVEGVTISVEAFCDEFFKTLDAMQVSKWSKIKVGKDMPRDKFPKGRDKSGKWYYGNISFIPGEPIGPKITKDPNSDYLILSEFRGSYAP